MGLFNFKSKKSVVVSPTSGEVLSITKCKDKVFSEKMMGDGFLIKPESGEFVSPVTGKVSMVFETKHAIAFTTNDGFEVLVHIGMDTVKLNGEGFEVLVNSGDKVKAGQKICNVDLSLIESKGYLTHTPVVITNLDGKEISLIKTGKCNKGEEIIEL